MTIDPDLRHSRYALGVGLVLMAGICLSFGGLILRHVEAANGWQILFYRSIAAAIAVFGFLVIRYRGRIVKPFTNIGRDGLVVAASLFVGAQGYVFALQHAPVADVMFILAASPVLMALAGWVFLRERVPASTWLAIGAGLVGMVVMFGQQASSGALLGKTLAFVIMVPFVFMVIALRRSKAKDLVPATCLGTAAVIPFTALVAGDLTISTHDLGLAVLLGTAQFGAGFLLMTLGSRYVPAAQVSLFMLTEPILAPVWVWMFVSEEPSIATLLGGALILGAVVAQSVIGIQKEMASRLRARVPRPSASSSSVQSPASD